MFAQIEFDHIACMVQKNITLYVLNKWPCHFECLLTIMFTLCVCLCKLMCSMHVLLWSSTTLRVFQHFPNHNECYFTWTTENSILQKITPHRTQDRIGVPFVLRSTFLKMASFSFDQTKQTDLQSSSESESDSKIVLINIESKNFICVHAKYPCQTKH